MSNLDTFFEKVRAAETELRLREGFDIIMYRGQRITDWTLTPGIFRGDYNPIDEEGIYCQFVNWSHEYDNLQDTWHVAFLMQHHGLPTRLLDWTESLGIAIYFALRHEQADAPCIWILNAAQMNKKFRDITHIPIAKFNNFGSELTYTHLIRKTSNVFRKPMAIAPPIVNRRIANQQGLFTVHGIEEGPLEKLCPEFVKKVDIPIGLVPQLHEYLRRFGINDRSMFPDLEGLVSFIRKFHKL